jgi:SAM-dependent methyltransferase
MHSSALANAKRFFDAYGPMFPDGAIVLDIGSQDVNGSLKDACPGRFNYVGIDFQEGKNVDLVMQDPYQIPVHDAKADIVVCSSTFEHSEMFWLLFLDILRVMKPDGLFYLNAPSNGPYHCYPVDCWRFYPDSAGAMVTWGKHNGMSPVFLESWWSKQGDDGALWNDYVAVFLKDEQHVHKYPNRIVYTVDQGKRKWSVKSGDVYNGKFYGDKPGQILDLQDLPEGGQTREEIAAKLGRTP